MNIELRSSYFSDDLIDTIKSLRGVEKAEGRNIFSVRVRTSGNAKWTKLNLVAIKDYEETEINRLRSVSGSSEPDKGEILLEKKASSKLGAGLGSDLEIQLEDGSIKTR